MLLCAFCTTVLFGCGSRAVEIQIDNTADEAETFASEAVAEIVALTEQELAETVVLTEQPLEWCYLTDSDAYVMQHGDTNAQNFTCIAGNRTGNQMVLDCLSEMTGLICRVTLELPENSEIWMFVSNVAVMNE